MVEDRWRKVATLAVTGVGFFMVLLDITIVSVALPTVQQDLGASLSGLSWVVDAYTLPFAALLLSFGTLGDRLGRKRLFVAGLVLFTLGSALCAVAPALGVLTAGRALQGAGGAALSPASLALIASAFPEVKERTRAIGVWSAITGLALAAGPLIGGVLIEATGSWRAVFVVNLPLGVLAITLGLRVLPETRTRVTGSFDISGQLLSIVGLTTVVFALAEGGGRGWTSPEILGCITVGGLLLAGFVVRQHRAGTPMLPLRFFRDRLFSSSAAATFGVGFALTSNTFFVSQIFQDVQHVSALGSGMRTLPTTVGIFVMAPSAGRLAARFGYRVPVTLGATLAGIGVLLLTRLHADTPYSAIWWALGVIGIGFGLTLSPLVAAVLSAVEPRSAGLASGVSNVARQLGGTLGVAALSTIVTARLAGLLETAIRATGIPAGQATRLAGTLAARGAAAANPGLPTTTTGPVPGIDLARVAGTAFATATHTAFLINGIVLIAAAAIAAAFLRPYPTATCPSTLTPGTIKETTS